MATTTKDETVSVRITAAEKRSLEADARRKGIPTGTVAAGYIAEGVRRSRFPAVEFRNGLPGRVAYLAGTRWPVWLIVELVKDYSGNVDAAAKHMNRPSALVQTALDYAGAYPEEIDADLQLAEKPAPRGTRVRLLTDEHFPAEIAQAVRREMPNFDIQSIHETNLAGLLDQPLLAALDLQHRTLLTRDVNSIPDFLKERLRDGTTHGGVIYVSSKFRQNDLRAVIRALVVFLKAQGNGDWACREGWL